VRVVVYLALAFSLALCLLVRREAPRMTPPRAVVSLATTAVLAAAAWVWNLALLAWTLIGQLTPVADAGHWSRLALAKHDPVPAVAALAAVGLLLVAVTGAARWTWHAAEQLRYLVATARSRPAGTDDGLVVVDDARPRAVAVPGLPGRVVLTTGLVKALDARERRVVLAHERAHLRYRHGEIRLLVRLAAAVLPVLKAVVTECDYQLERWADEAAATVADRRAVARALARAALAGTTRQPVHQDLPAFAEHAVTRRVRALLDAPPEGGASHMLAPLAGLAVTAALTIEASRDLEALFELAMRLWKR
jgi:Zn-dependent protease with chaperone function